VSDRGYIDRVREANDIVEYIGEVLKLRRAGGDYAALCPFHDEKTPSFTVSPRKQIFHCFGCGVGGDVIAFAMRYDNLGFGPALIHCPWGAECDPERPFRPADRPLVTIPSAAAGPLEWLASQRWSGGSQAVS